MPTNRSPHEVHFRCRARIRRSNRQRDSLLNVILLWAMGIAATGGALEYFLVHPSHHWAFPYLLGFAGFCLVLLLLRTTRPWSIGELVLHGDQLTFRWWHRKRWSIDLAEVQSVGRKRREIQVAPKRGATTYYFACARLAGEDLYDRLVDRIEELGLDTVKHERPR